MKQKTKNKIAFISIGFAITVILAGLIMGLIMPGSELANTTLYMGLSSGQLISLIIMVLSGTITNTIYWKIIRLCLAIAIIGLLFRIQHWFGSDIILTASFVGIGITYLASFITKSQKGHLDILKFLWVITACIISILIIEHRIPEEALLIAHGLFCLTLTDFIVTGQIKRPIVRN